MSESYKQGRKAQVSIEYIMVVGFAFLMLIPLILVFYTSSSDLNDQITNSQADKIANELTAAADQVYFQGAPTMRTLKIFFPENVKEIVIQDNWIKVNTRNYDGVPRTSAANLSGSLIASGGLHKITVEAVEGGVVISE